MKLQTKQNEHAPMSTKFSVPDYIFPKCFCWQLFSVTLRENLENHGGSLENHST